MKLPVIIDTDPGVDDFLAILMAARSPEFDLMGLTTVGGNTPLRHATRNALRALAEARRTDVPVVPGASRPLHGWFQYAPQFHGRSGLTARSPLPPQLPRPQGAEDLIARACEQAHQPIVLIPVGPLTNIARLLSQYPVVANRIERVVIMGGAVDCSGNVTSAAEFNIYNDPEAANVVLQSRIPITLVGLDVCRKVGFSRDDAKEGHGTAHRLLRGWFQRDHRRTQFDLCDPLAIAVTVDPSLVETERIAIRVRTEPGPNRGATERSPSGPLIDVALKVDAARARRLIKERVLG